MYLTWRQRLVQRPDLFDINNWPKVCSLSLDEMYRKQYLQRKNMVHRVLRGMEGKEAARLAGLSKSSANYFMNRCLAGEENDEPHLTAGLIPNKQLRTPMRKSTLSNLKSDRIGARCAFKKVLAENSYLVEQIDERIIIHQKRLRNGENLTLARAFRYFLKLLADLNWPTDRYPLDQDKQGYESFRRYYNNRVIELSIPKPKYNKLIHLQPKVMRAFEEIQIDEQRTDAMASYVLELDGELKPLRIPRLHIYTARCVATNCVLAIHVCMSSPPNQEDLLMLLKKIHTPWQPMKLKTHGLEYAPGAGYPSSLSEEIRNLGIGIIRLDNALAHHANSVRWFVSDVLGATLNIGLPKHPQARNLVEHGFKILNRINHRFPSTTGKNHQDPVRESKLNYKKPPELRLHEFIEVMDVVHASFNAEKQIESSGTSPLDQIRFQFENSPMHINFGTVHMAVDPFVRREPRSVRYRKSEGGCPVISFKSMPYKGDCLHDPRLVGRGVEIEINLHDIRELIVYDLSGKRLGTVKAPKSQQNFPLSIRSLEAIRRGPKGDKGITFSCIDDMFDYRIEHAGSLKNDLELVRIWREISTEGFVDLRAHRVKSGLSEIGGASYKSGKLPEWSDFLSNRSI